MVRLANGIKTKLDALVSTMAIPYGGIPFVAAGTEIDVAFRFRCLMTPDVYFVNAGVVGLVDGREVYLHRIVDALMIRVSEYAGRVVNAASTSIPTRNTRKARRRRAKPQHEERPRPGLPGGALNRSTTAKAARRADNWDYTRGLRSKPNSPPTTNGAPRSERCPIIRLRQRRNLSQCSGARQGRGSPAGLFQVEELLPPCGA